MAIDSVKSIKIARRIGMSWMTVTIVGALATGLTGVAYVNKFNVKLGVIQINPDRDLVDVSTGANLWVYGNHWTK